MISNHVISLSEKQINKLFSDNTTNKPPPPLAPVIKLTRALTLFKDALRRALYSVLTPAIYVFSADCGTGKSKAVQTVLAEWKAKGFAGGGGVIIFVGTLAEVDAYKDGAGLDHADYAVLSPNPIYSKYGAGYAAAGTVPVLFVTHEKARRVLTGLPSFADATAFHWNGKPRALRVWEEAFQPVEYASFSRYDLMLLPGALKGLSRADADLFSRLVTLADGLAVGTSFAVPLAVRDAANRVFKSKVTIGGEARRTLDAIAKLAGCKAQKIDDDDDCRFIGVGLTMPADMGPLFVLDASARLSARYSDWSHYGMRIERLEPALINYHDLTIHWWNKGCGKTVLRNGKERERVYGAIADLINSKPKDDFLIVMAKEFASFGKNNDPKLPDGLEAQLTDADRVKVTTWGRHLSSNDHREVANVILMGSWQYDESAYHAISLAITGDLETCMEESVKGNTKSGEFKHNIYQAVCRSLVRNRVGASCTPANAYFIMPETSQNREQIQEAFPNCLIEAWSPLPAKKESKAERVLAAVLSLTASRMFVPFKDVIQVCGSSQKSYLSKLRKDDRFVSLLKANRIKIAGNGPASMFIRSTVGTA